MVRGNGPVRGDPAELKIFSRRVRDDAVNTPAFERDAGGFGPVAIALEGFAEGAHVHIVNRGVQLGPGTGGPLARHHGLLDGVHAADRRAKIRIALRVPGADTLEPGNAGDGAAVRGPNELASRGAGAAEQTFELDARHHVRQGPVAVGVLSFGRVVIAGPPAHDDGADFQFGADRRTQILIDLDDLGNQAVRVERFDQVVQRPDLHGFHRGFHGGIGRHHDHGQIRKELFGLLEHFYPVHAGHPNVREDDVWRFRRCFGQGLLAVPGGGDLGAGGGPARERDRAHAGDGRGRAAGSSRRWLR